VRRKPGPALENPHDRLFVRRPGRFAILQSIQLTAVNPVQRQHLTQILGRGALSERGQRTE
jgi:hypothetical protein